MTLRPLFAGIALLAAAPAIAADTNAPQQSAQSDTGTVRTPAPRPEARKPVTPLRSGVIEAPGAAWMLIPASWSPARSI